MILAKETHNWKYQRFTRNSSGDEIANVNFLYDDIVCIHTKNTIDSCINSATDRFLQRVYQIQ